MSERISCKNKGKTCKEEGCSRPARTLLLCESHYRSGLRRRLTVKCKIDGCSSTRLAAKGLCEKHYGRLRRTGTTKDPVRLGTTTCKVDGCNSVSTHLKMQLCKKHYYRETTYGDTSPSVLQKKRYTKDDQCLIASCKKIPKRKHLCMNHYHSYYRYFRKNRVEDVGDFVIKYDANEIGYRTYIRKGD